MTAELQLFGGRYAILQDVKPRRGGMSTVYACSDLGAGGRRVAVKIISPPREYDHLEGLIYERELNVQELTHPNIVQLYDVGIDADDKYFLVYEWVPKNLNEWLQENKQIGADDFVEGIALPLLRGLALAHERQIVHRDIKPSNVLVGDTGTPKLADFGISKVKYKLADESETLYTFSSKPYSPPEDESHSSYTRDVFGYGVLLLASMSESPVETYDDFDHCLDSIDAAPALIDLIGDCVNLNEFERPRNAVQLLAQLEDLQRGRRKKWLKTETLYFTLKRATINAIAAETQISEDVVSELVEQELSEAPAIRLLAPDPGKILPVGEIHAFIYGDKWSFRMSLSRDKPVVEFIGAKYVGDGECDDRRDKHFVAKDWRFSSAAPLDHLVATKAIERLIDGIDSFDSDLESSRLEREDQRLFDQWRRQLDARESTDLDQADRLHYKHVEVEGQRATFQLDGTSEGIVVEQRRTVLDAAGSRIASGEIEGIVDGELKIYLDHEPASSLPTTGSLVIDTSASREKLRRERKALNAVRFATGDLRRTDLPQLLVHPEGSAPPAVSADDLVWLHTDLDESKRSAVSYALNSPDFFLVQGPPGTGKTSFIAELVGQEFLRDRGIRILLASQTHVALDNALLRIRDLGLGARLLRLGNPASGKIAEDVADLTLDNQLNIWRTSVKMRSEQFLENLVTAKGGDLTLVRVSLELSQLASLLNERLAVKKQIDLYESRMALSMDASEESTSLTREELEDIEADLATQRARRSQLDRDARRIMDKRDVAKHLKGRASHDARLVVSLAEELLSRATGNGELTSIVELQGRWLERLGRGPEFQAALLSASQVVAGTCVGLARASGIDEVPFDLCIVDEASKATATEALIPLVRAKRWVLVGDERQLPPFQDEALHDSSVIAEFELDRLELERSLFSRLAAGLPSVNVNSLTTQYRMVPAIGDLISNCFYEGQLKSHAKKPQWEATVWQPAAVTWFSTELLRDREEQRRGQGSPSYLNVAEAREVIRYLQRLEDSLAHLESGRSLHVLVLAPYRRQIAELARRVNAVRQHCPHLSIEVNTVDAVQGREADAVVFSTVRSNSSGQMGFVRDIARANVALSRGRCSLAIFGDAAFFDRVSSPLQIVLSYIRTHPTACALEMMSR